MNARSTRQRGGPEENLRLDCLGYRATCCRNKPYTLRLTATSTRETETFAQYQQLQGGRRRTYLLGHAVDDAAYLSAGTNTTGRMGGMGSKEGGGEKGREKRQASKGRGGTGQVHKQKRCIIHFERQTRVVTTLPPAQNRPHQIMTTYSSSNDNSYDKTRDRETLAAPEIRPAC